MFYFSKQIIKTFIKLSLQNIFHFYYRIENTNLELLRFWNTFQDTKKFKL